MRIAQIAPLTESVPPQLYGGTERVVSYLTEELVRLGHQVTLFASGDSVTSAELHSGWPKALRFDSTVRDLLAPALMQLEDAMQRTEEFDVLHFHLDYMPFSLFSRQRVPFVTTLHGRLDLPELAAVFDRFPRAAVVSISNAQRRPLPQANFVRTIYHGMPTGLVTPRPVKPAYLAFLGRIAPEKAPDRAIRIARRAGIPLKIAAKVDRVDEAYWRERIRPLVDGKHIEMLGEIGDAEKSDFLSGAVALLTPIDWPEPFGLVMIEAMAAGTPVIAFNRGSVPEIVEQGLTGFVVEDEQSAVAAVSRAAALPRAAIRRRFEERFSAERMAREYLDLYRELSVERRPRLRAVT
ncbi:MAG TPA: glycosyltransferase family 4 protein [Acetobacteraceae bacterium]|nr:glycosyltransferase family 4 protein [Acetobacteraceae bacterium]